MLTVSLERSEYTVSEGVDIVTVAVLLEGVTAVNISVYLTTIDSGNATGGGKLSLISIMFVRSSDLSSVEKYFSFLFQNVFMFVNL